MCLDSPSIPDASQTAGQTLAAQVKYAPSVYQQNAQFSPLYNGLNLANLNSFLNGSPETSTTGQVEMTAGANGWYDAAGNLVGAGGTPRPAGNVFGHNAGDSFMGTKTTTNAAQPGFLSMYSNSIMPALTEASTRANTATRTANLADAYNLAPNMAAAERAGNPQGADLLDKLSGSVSNELSYGTQLTPAERMQMNQSVRGGAAARGMGFGPSDVFNESMADTGFGQSLLTQRQNQAGSVIPQLSSFYQNPLVLAGMGSGNTMGSASVAGAAAGGAAPSQSGEFDPTGQFAQLLQNQGWEQSQASSMNQNMWETRLGGSASSY